MSHRLSPHFKKIKSRLERLPPITYYLLILLLLEFLFLYQKDVFSLLGNSMVAGRDLVGHLAFSHIFQQTGLVGWTNNWLMGLPGFTFYPPLFFLAVNVVSWLSLGLLTITSSFKLITFLSVAAFPFSVYFCLYKLNFGPKRSFFSGILAIYYLFVPRTYPIIHQGLREGLIAQVFAWNLLLVLLPFLWRPNTRKRRLLAGTLLGLLLLAHPYLFAVAVLALTIKLVVDVTSSRTLRALKQYLIQMAPVLALGLLVASPWLLNLLPNYAEFYQSGPAAFHKFPLFLIPLLLLSLNKSRKRLWLFLLFLTCYGLGTIEIPFLSGSLPLQYKRFYHYGVGLSFLLAGLGLSKIYYYLRGNKTIKTAFEKLKISRYKSWFLIVLLIAPLLLTIASAQLEETWRSEQDYQQLYAAIEELGAGRILLEVDESNESQAFILQETIPLKTGKPVLNEIHVDSSLSSPYTLALRYWLSENPVGNPVCDLCQQGFDLSPQLFVNHLRRFNVRWVIVKSQESKDKLEDLLPLAKEVNEFSIFRAPSSSYYQVLDYKPILLVSSLSKWKAINREIFTNEQLANYTYLWSPQSPSKQEKSLYSASFNLKNKSVEQAISTLKRNLEEVEKATTAAIKSFKASEEKIELKLSGKSGPKPILLKYSYFPRWQCDNCRLYLASPSLILIYVNNIENKVTLNYGSTLSKKGN